MARIKKKLRNELIISLIVVAIAVPLVMFSSQLQINDEIAGVTGIYAIVEDFNPFSEMALVKSTAIKCSGTDTIYVTTDTSTTRQIHKVGFEDEIIPAASLSLVTNTGKTVKNFDGEVKIQCSKVTSKIVNPHFAGGLIYLVVYATDSDGKTIKIKEQQLPLSNAQVNANGVKLTIAKWTLKPEEIESKLAKSGNFKSTVTTNIVGTLHFKTFKDEKQTWKYTIRDGFATAYTFTVNKGPDIGLFDLDVAQRKVELKLINPTDGKVNLAKVNRANLVGSLYDWEEKEGLPIVKVYYNDEKASPSEKITPIFQKTLTEKKGTSGKGKVMDFPITIPLLKTAKLGEYKVTFSSAEKNGSPIRNNVGTMAFYVVNEAEKPKEPEPEEEDVPGGTTEEEEKEIDEVCEQLGTTEKDPQQYVQVIDRLASGKAKDMLLNSVANNKIFDICKIEGSINDILSIGSGLMPVIIGGVIFIIIIAIAATALKRKPQQPRY